MAAGANLQYSASKVIEAETAEMISLNGTSRTSLAVGSVQRELREQRGHRN